MSDARNRFAEIPPEPERGDVRRFPVLGGSEPADEGDQVLVRHLGVNTVYPDRQAFVDAVLAQVERRNAGLRQVKRSYVLSTVVLPGVFLGALVALACCS